MDPQPYINLGAVSCALPQPSILARPHRNVQPPKLQLGRFNQNLTSNPFSLGYNSRAATAATAATSMPKRPSTPSPERSGTPPSVKRLDGLWSNDKWWCKRSPSCHFTPPPLNTSPGNCEPRAHAVIREVRKNTPNKGRFFWTCARSKCNFFLWRDQAALRETGTGTPDSRPPTMTQRQLESYGVFASPSKRKRSVTPEDDLFSDLGSDEERQLADLADSAKKPPPETPARARVLHGLPTPSVSRTLFPVKANDDDASTACATPSTVGTEATQDVSDEIMALLRTQKLDPVVLRRVDDLLATSARRARGAALGRDSARAALQRKDKIIAELQERVTALENRDKTNRRTVTSMKAQLMRVYEDH